MKRILKFAFLSVTLYFSMLGLSAAPVHAQEPTVPTGTETPDVTTTPATPSASLEITVVIPDESLEVPVDQLRPDGSQATFADFLGELTVFVDDVECATVSMTGDESRNADGKVMSVGLSDQPAGCALEGGRITFVDGFGRALNEEFTLVPGSTYTLSNLAPKPVVDTGAPSSLPSTGGESLTTNNTPNEERALIGVLVGAASGLILFGAVKASRRLSERRRS